ncbi:MAG: energy-coupling factor transporter transmembrane protein EcfT [Clostridia bacterium]|nr:energy-coupling factor transporter transmembrane protein EcfT [Clostridia bacterium]
MRDFSDSHPLPLILFFVCALFQTMTFTHPAVIAAGFIGALLYYILLKGRKALSFVLRFCLPTLVLVTFINGMTAHYGVTKLFTSPWGADIRLEPIVRGFVMGVTVVVALLWFACFYVTVTSEKLVFALSGGIPQISLIITSALRFAPLYSRSMRESYDARRVNSGGKSNIKNAAKALEGTLYATAERSIITANSMEARGYGLPGAKRYVPFAFTPQDLALTVLTALFSAVLIAGFALGSTKTLYNPQIILPESSVGLVVVCACSAALSLMPSAVTLFSICRDRPVVT